MSNCCAPTQKIGPEDYVVIQPTDKAECIIRSKFISELNGPLADKPATLYIQDPDLPPTIRKEQQVVLLIPNEEYDRLRMILAGYAPMPSMEQFRQMVDVVKENPGLTMTEVDVEEGEEAPAPKKTTTKKKGSTKK